MKTFLIAVDTSGLYDHEARKKDVLSTLRSLCPNTDVTLVTFDERGIVHHEVQSFLNSDIQNFMERPAYREVLELLEDFDAQQMFTGYINLDVLMMELNKYSLDTFGFEEEV